MPSGSLIAFGDSRPAPISRAAMMPIVFCASLAPWPRLNAAAETSCSPRNVRLTRRRASDAVDDPHHRDDQDEADRQADQRRVDDERRRLAQPVDVDHARTPALAMPAPTMPPIERVRRRRRQAEVRGQHVPEDRTDEPGEDRARCETTSGSTILAISLATVERQDEERGEVPERRPQHRLERLEHPRRDDRGDRVRRVVEPVDEVEDERDRRRPR